MEILNQHPKYIKKNDVMFESNQHDDLFALAAKIASVTCTPVRFTSSKTKKKSYTTPATSDVFWAHTNRKDNVIDILFHCYDNVYMSESDMLSYLHQQFDTITDGGIINSKFKNQVLAYVQDKYKNNEIKHTYQMIVIIAHALMQSFVLTNKNKKLQQRFQLFQNTIERLLLPAS